MKNRIGIRREDKNNWEKRAPLIPTHVRELIQERDLDVWVQSSSIRVFNDQEYIREGARVVGDLGGCSIVFSIKEIPPHAIDQEKVYIFFSHATKGQAHNLPMLKRLLSSGCTLIDYERVMNKDGQRLIFFGVQAGQAGMIETLSILGRRLAHEGIKNPFESIKQPYQYQNLVEAKEEVERVGWKIHEQGLDMSLVPLVCGFNGYGRSSHGAQEIFDLLPALEIKPGDLAGLFKRKEYSSHAVYKVVFKEEDLVKPISRGSSFDLQDYYQNPQKYSSVFHAYLPFLTCLVNCVYWEPHFPRFVTNESLAALYSKMNQPRLRIIGDISCDIQGSIECTVKITSPANPVFVFDPLSKKTQDGVSGRGIVIMSIDNLPAEIPLESSVYFSSTLKPFVPEIAKADFMGEFSACVLPAAIKNAVILYRGELTPNYQYLQEFLDA